MTGSSDVYISGTSTDPAIRADGALRAESARILAGYREKAALVTDLQLDGPARSEARARLAEFAAGPLRDYLTATDRVLNATAAGAAPTRLLVRALRRWQDGVLDTVDELLRSDTSAQASHAAQALDAVLAGYLEVETAVLLPALAELPGADFPLLADDLRTLLRGGRLETPVELDVREIPHGTRHPRIFGRYARLAPGESFVLVNNHDPKPLRREFAATHGEEFTWEYEESGPERWRVRIGRAAAPA
ncbi:DUF2249 domain-containing protein [Amycolatopsis benzoatilytica]|uniref:DUF2249 domain-containing protein n=1 Tax=Amycolatopsis benzoatilytica TaxID=346045 RepID=UPI00037E1E96|nr:DUF2249 domain-containing protein [Amycolatopsis benzoatilytica]